MTQPPNVHRVTNDPNPDSLNHRRLGYVDAEGAYHFPDGTCLPATGGVTDPEGVHRQGATPLVVTADGEITTQPPLDYADQERSALTRLHHVDRAQQDAYDLEAFGRIGGDPVPPTLPAGTFTTHTEEN